MTSPTIVPTRSGDAQTPARDGVSFELQLDRRVYAAFPPQPTTLAATLVLSNRNAAPLPLLFAGGQQFDIEILDGGGTQVALWSAGRIFDDLAQTIEVQGRQSWKASMTLPQANDASLAAADYTAADYTATAWLTASGPAPAGAKGHAYSASVGFTVRPAPVVLQQRPA